VLERIIGGFSGTLGAGLDISQAQLSQLNTIDPLQECSDYGISLFIQALQVLS